MRTPLTWFFPSSALRQHFSNFPTTTHSEKHICWHNPAWAYVYMCFRKKIDKSVLNAVCSYFPFKSNWFVLSWLCTSAKPLQLCLTLCIPMHCSPPGFSIHGILQARILKWIAISFSKGSSLAQGSNLGQGSPFSVTVVPIYIPTKSVEGFPFLHAVTNTCYLWPFWDGHSD